MKNQQPSPGPWRPVLALILVGAGVLSLARLCPPEGWNVAGTVVKLTVPEALAPYLLPEVQQPIVHRWAPEDLQDLLNEYDAQLAASEETDAAAVDSTTPSASPPLGVSDTLHSKATLAPHSAAGPPLDSATKRRFDPPKVAIDIPSAEAFDRFPQALRVRIPESAQSRFDSLFQRLDEGAPISVLHYGDSQIEGDRISGTLRHKWQERWGGYGPGIQPPVPLVQSFALSQTQNGSWKRHTRFGRRDTTDQDENYGLLASYATATLTKGDRACLTLQPERRAHGSFGQWDGLSIWHDSVAVESVVFLNGQPVDTLWAGDPAGQLRFTTPRQSASSAPKSEVCFDAAPPRLFAVHPIGAGVQWHAVAMRGSSGTLFRKLHRPTYAKQLQRIDPDLIVLQFGGNTVPYCKDSLAAQRYAGWLGRQIQLFQSLVPEAAILVIGPSDMAEKKGLDWTPFPQLLSVRDAIKKVSFDVGAAHWDLLDVMGGVGSMPAWVQAEPALAGADHVHLTPLGAKKVGALLDRALWAEFRSWQQRGKPVPMTRLSPRAPQEVPSNSSLQHVP